MGLDTEVVQGDAEKLPFADASFDRVSSNGVLHHTPDMPAALQSRTRTSPGGEARIIVYNRSSFHYWLMQVAWMGIIRGGLILDRSMSAILSNGVEVSTTAAKPLVRVYRPNGLRALMRSAGFQPVEIAIRHFHPGETWLTEAFSGLRLFQNPAVLDRIGRNGGWYVVATGGGPAAA